MLKYNNKVLKFNSRWLGNDYGVKCPVVTMVGNGDFWYHEEYTAMSTSIVGFPRMISVYAKFHAPTSPDIRANRIIVEPKLTMTDRTKEVRAIDFITEDTYITNTEDMWYGVMTSDSNIIKFTINWSTIEHLSPQEFTYPLELGYIVSNATGLTAVTSDVYTTIYY